MKDHVPTKITVHCSATLNGRTFSIEAIRKDHKARGFEDIGYHKVIDVDGTVYDGRPLNKVGAHVEGHNTGNLGICLIGTDKFTQAQFNSLRSVLDGLFLNFFQILKSELYCHNQFDTAIKQGKICPGMSINKLLTWYLTHDENIVGEFKLKG